jgi:methyl-accepting chemotaxis protein
MTPPPGLVDALERCLTSCAADLERAAHLTDEGVAALTASFDAFRARLGEQQAFLSKLTALVEGEGRTEGFAARMQRLTEGFLADVSMSEQASRHLLGRLEAISPDLHEMDAQVRRLRGLAHRERFIALNAQLSSQKLGARGRSFAVVAEEMKGLAEHGARLAAEVSSGVEATNRRLHEVDACARSLEGVDPSGAVEAQSSLMALLQRLRASNQAALEAVRRLAEDAARAQVALSFGERLMPLLSRSAVAVRHLAPALQAIAQTAPWTDGCESIWRRLEGVLTSQGAVQQASLDAGTVELF